ncbi:predicted protein [Naegleria gruberi]|uniref:Predicted protein n=1 Tax=Naegleria gruberi TaxID=5762 RepID=D2VHB2_NAEGR|nr:uncharacterized protein NAEGRDRAFT_68153 [Naegleria gruberi]EFC43772.1 predicted protein [Naegleria gruberi]|eukprot:XP_002676516.1 predicted protein [Naegleria gruberi strain NEG-M]
MSKHQIMISVTLACLLLVTTVASKVITPSSRLISVTTPSDRAAISVNSFIDKFLDPKSNYLFDTFTNSSKTVSPLTGYWTFAQGFHSIIDNAFRISQQKQSLLDKPFSYYVQLISQLYSGQDKIGWDRPYVDDMNWMGITLFWAFKVTGNQTYLDKCLYLYQIIEGNWDETCCGSVKGGIWWDYSHSQKATASNAGPAILASLLYQEIGNLNYLSFSLKVFNFWNNLMVDKKTSAVCDHISAKGDIECSWRFTYNEGLMIGAATNLYKITNNQTYLNIASNIANFMISNEVTFSKIGGTVLFDGTNCVGDCVQFKGIAFRYLQFLFNNLNDNYPIKSKIQQVLNSSVESIWELARNPNLELFGVNWAGPSPSNTLQYYEAQVNSVVMTLSLAVSQQLK